MATKNASAKPAAKTPAENPKLSKSREVANWDEELAKQAAAAAETESSTATGNYFSTKGGILAWNDSPLKGNEMACVILDAVLENVYYGSDYDPDEPQGPQCFAFGRDEKTMAPHEDVIEAGTEQNETCHGCPMNEFGTAEKGKGKACRNVRRLGLIPAGSFDKNGMFEPEEDEEAYKNAELGFLKLPVTSVKAYAAYVKTLAASMKRPPLGVFTKISVVPDAKTQFKVTFEALGLVPNELMGIVMERKPEAVATIESPYKVGEIEEKVVKGPASRKGAAAKPINKRKF
jgi:hypothetical protein